MRVNWPLHIMAGAAIGLIVGQVVWPTATDAAGRTRDAFFWLAISYLPGYLVYTLVVALPRWRDISKMSLFIANKTANLVGDGQSLLKEIQKAAGQQEKWPETKANVEAACSKIKPNSQAPLVVRTNPIQYANWTQFLFHYKQRSESFADQILTYMPYLEAEHVRIITDIRHCTLFGILEHVKHGVRNDDLSFLAEAIHGHHELAVELDQFREKNMAGVAWSKRRR